jgi:hypothetical protein
VPILLAYLLLHFLAQTQRTHIRPYFFDVLQALCFASALAGVIPARSVVAMGWPDGILLFVVHNHSVNGVVGLLCCHNEPLSIIFVLLTRR